MKPGDRVEGRRQARGDLSAGAAGGGRSQAAVLAQAETEILAVELEIAKKRLSIAEREVKVRGEDLPEAKETLTATEQELHRAQAMFEAGTLGSREVAQARMQPAEARAAWLHAGERVKNAQDEVEIARLEVYGAPSWRSSGSARGSTWLAAG